jgi:hypothetical protein
MKKILCSFIADGILVERSDGGQTMLHTFFALFDGADDATAAVREIEEAGKPGQHCDVIVRSDVLDAESLGPGETRSRSQAVETSLLTAACAALIGALVLGPLGIAGGPLGAAFAAGLAGLIIGVIMGAIAGASLPDRTLERMAGELPQGKTLVTVEAPGLGLAEQAETIVRHHGGRVEHRAVL